MLCWLRLLFFVSLLRFSNFSAPMPLARVPRGPGTRGREPRELHGLARGAPRRRRRKPGAPEVGVGKAPEVGRWHPGVTVTRGHFRVSAKGGRQAAGAGRGGGQWDLHTLGPRTILLSWVEYQTRVSPSCTSPQPGNRQEKQRARPTDCHWQNELSPPIFQRRGGMNCSLEPCGPLLIEFRCLRTPSNKASSFQADVPPLINLGASKINRFGADLFPPPAWIPHPERSPNKSLRVLLASLAAWSQGSQKKRRGKRGRDWTLTEATSPPSGPRPRGEKPGLGQLCACPRQRLCPEKLRLPRPGRPSWEMLQQTPSLSSETSLCVV